MDRMMRAVLVEEIGKPFTIGQIPVPTPAYGEVLVRIVTSGVCPTDMSIANGEWLMKRPRVPYVPGHEGAGYVVEIGAGVSRVKEGDRVGIFWLNSCCGCCQFCISGRENLCLKQESTGYTINGTHAEYCVVNADYVIALPKGDFEELTPVMCAGVTSYKGVKEMNAQPGSRIAVVGVGATGHLAIQYAKAVGYTVIALDVDESRLALAEELGADQVINAKQSFNKINFQSGRVDAALVTAPAVQPYERAIRMLKRGGTCVLIGVPRETVPLPMLDMIIQELVLKGSVIGTRQDVAEALQFVSEGKVKVVSECLPMEEVNRAVDDVTTGKVRGRLLLKISEAC